MKKKQKVLLSVFVIVYLFFQPLISHAGGWAKGYGNSVEEAQKNAIDAAKNVISTRGAGCVSGKVRLLEKESDLWVVEAHFYQHNGSCGKSNDNNWVNDPCKLNSELPVCDE